jgi:general secretion pathway protein G
MRRTSGFTLIELLVVMTIMALLLAIAAPRYFNSVGRAKEAALKTNLRMLREAIDQHRADTGQFPASLNQLVERRYLRAVPIDPVTETDRSWVLLPHPDGSTPGIYDVRSGAAGSSSDGGAYATW